MIQVTPKLLSDAAGCAAALAATYAPHIGEAVRLWGIGTRLRLAGFLAHIAYESSRFSATEENLNYRADRIRQLAENSKPGTRWSSLGPRANALARNPEALANAAYSTRMGNGDEASGDGWRYRGRGLKQLTGRTNYEAIGEAVRAKVPDAPSFVDHPEVVALPRWAALSAGAFWDENELNELADAQDFRRLTIKINGGTFGIEDRAVMYRHALRILPGG